MRYGQFAMVRMRRDPRTHEGLTIKEIRLCLKLYIIRDLYSLILIDLSNNRKFLTWERQCSHEVLLCAIHLVTKALMCMNRNMRRCALKNVSTFGGEDQFFGTCCYV